MRFLVDEALQDRLVQKLADAGHDAAHVRLIGMQGATDEDVLACALRERRVLITTDTDFGDDPGVVWRRRTQRDVTRSTTGSPQSLARYRSSKGPWPTALWWSSRPTGSDCECCPSMMTHDGLPRDSGAWGSWQETRFPAADNLRGLAPC